MPSIAELSVADWHRLNRLLEAALTLEPAARSTWLHALPSSDADLLPLLEQLLSPKDLTETAQFAAPLAAQALAQAARLAAEQAGQRLGPYRLLRELGVGGMGTVWLAERADGAFERQVALKLPRAEWTDRGLAQRFARERAMLASLNHPHIAQLYDAGWSEAGRPYLALEFVEGEPLPAWCAQQQLDLRLRLALFVDVIRAVAHAHARLIVHRDLKPSNVLVTAEAQVKLLDFGIAKLLTGGSPTGEETELTRLAGRPLTPNYAAPEQILGQPISTAADIYALGVLLFELLTGERPYRLGRDVRRAALEEAIVHADVPAPSSVVKDQASKRALRGDLDAIVLKALRKQPEQRYETAAAFADDIERYLNRLPVRAQPASRLYRLQRFLTRNRFAVAAVGAVIAALAVGLGIALWQATVARDEAARATTIKDFVLSIIQQADPVASRQTREADVALLTTAEARIDKELEKQPELALQMRRAIGAAYRNRGEYLRASQVLRKGIEQARTVLPPDNLELLGAYVQIAEERVIDTRSALDDLVAAIEALRNLGPSAQPLVADALLARLRVVKMTSSVEQVREYADEAYRAARATGDAGRMLDAAVEVLESHYILLTPEDAAAVLAEARQYAAQDGRIEPNDPRWITATAFHGVATCKYGMAHKAVREATAIEGLELTQSAVKAAQAHHGADSRVNEVAIFALGLARWCATGAKSALGAMRDAYAMAIKREPPGSINRLWRTFFLIKVLFDADERAEIENVLRATPIWDPAPGAISTSPIYPPSVMRLWEATMRLGLGDTETAERLAEEAVPLIEQEAGPFVVDTLFDVLARALYENGKYARAESFALKAFGQETKARQAIFLSIDRLFLLSNIRLELANYEGAIEAADRALALLPESDSRNAHILARANLRRGRALLALGQYADAVEALSATHTYWEAQSAGPGPTSYWYGRALIASGDVKSGQALVDATLPVLAASHMPSDRAIAAREGVKPKDLAAAGRQ